VKTAEAGSNSPRRRSGPRPGLRAFGAPSACLRNAGPGDFAIMPPAHDAWIVGDDPCAVVDWQGFADYAKAA
jgi:hypothetical protein